MTTRFLISKDSKYFIPQITVLLALISSLSPFATDTYIPALPEMADYFGRPINMLEITLTLYFIGVAVGQLFGGPLSDSFGRKKIAVLGLILYCIPSILAVFVTDVYILWILRFTQALGGGAASVVNMAFVRDWFEGKEVARLSSLISMIMMVAPLVAPMIGSFLLAHWEWPSIFIFMFGVSFLILILFVLVVPESRPQDKITNKITVRQITHSYKTVFKSPKAVLLVMCSTFAVSGMFTFLTSASFLYIEYFNVGVGKFPLYFGANIALNVMLTILNYRLVKVMSPLTLLHFGLILQLLGGFSILIAVNQPEPNLWFVFLSIVVFVGSLGLIFANIVAVILNQFHMISGSANAVIGVTRFAISGGISSLVAVFHTGDLIPMGVIMFCCTTIAYLLFWWSKFARA